MMGRLSSLLEHLVARPKEVGSSRVALVSYGSMEWPHAISTTYPLGEVDSPPPLPRGFRWDKKALQETLAEVKKKTRLEVLPQYHYSDRWMAIYGHLEAKTTRVDIRGYLHVGYGHLGSAPAQLVWPEGGWRRLR